MKMCKLTMHFSDLFEYRVSDSDEKEGRLKAFDGLIQTCCDEIRKKEI